jgi:hypothetical protein
MDKRCSLFCRRVVGDEKTFYDIVYRSGLEDIAEITTTSTRRHSWSKISQVSFNDLGREY